MKTNKIFNLKTILLLLLLPACSFSKNAILTYQAQSYLAEGNLRVDVKVINQSTQVQSVSNLPFTIKLYENQNQTPSWEWDLENHDCPSTSHQVGDVVVVISGAPNIVTQLTPNESSNIGAEVPLTCIPLKGHYQVQAVTVDNRDKTIIIDAGKIDLP